MLRSEVIWGRKVGLVKTDLRTLSADGSYRNVYKATKGTYAGGLFYADAGQWNGTYPEYCTQGVSTMKDFIH